MTTGNHKMHYTAPPPLQIHAAVANIGSKKPGSLILSPRHSMPQCLHRVSPWAALIASTPPPACRPDVDTCRASAAVRVGMFVRKRSHEPPCFSTSARMLFLFSQPSRAHHLSPWEQFTFSEQETCLLPLLGQSINTPWKPLLQRETNYVAGEE